MTRSIVVLTGAGISAESGIDTFRAQGGIWERHRIEDIATPEAFARDAARVHEFYNARRRQLARGQHRCASLIADLQSFRHSSTSRDW